MSLSHVNSGIFRTNSFSQIKLKSTLFQLENSLIQLENSQCLSWGTVLLASYGKELKNWWSLIFAPTVELIQTGFGLNNCGVNSTDCLVSCIDLLWQVDAHALWLEWIEFFSFFQYFSAFWKLMNAHFSKNSCYSRYSIINEWPHWIIWLYTGAFFFIFLLRNKESVTETSVSFSVLWHSCTESFGCTRCLFFFFFFFVFAQQRICNRNECFFFCTLVLVQWIIWLYLVLFYFFFCPTKNL